MTLVAKKQPGRPCDKALQERRREAILKVAGGLFARHGFTATDVQWVADALRISKGTVYRYFPSKEKLFLAAVARGICRMQEHIESAKSGVADKVEEIRAAVIAYLRFFKKNPELVELFIQERANSKANTGRFIFSIAMRAGRFASISPVCWPMAASAICRWSG